MSELAMVGIDLGKHSFHLHGQDKIGREIFRKRLSRQQMMRFFSNLPVCTVAMEACAGAHFVARQLIEHSRLNGHPVSLDHYRWRLSEDMKRAIWLVAEHVYRDKLSDGLMALVACFCALSFNFRCRPRLMWPPE